MLFEAVNMDTDLDKLAFETLTEKAQTNFVRVDGIFLPEDYKKYADEVENFQVEDDDVWVCSFQKSGKLSFKSIQMKKLIAHIIMTCSIWYYF